MLSYLWVRIHPPKDKATLEGFVASRFGWRLYRHFFKTQSEKVWGVPCTEIQADWGAQRIKNLSLFRAGWEAIKPRWLKNRQATSKQVTSLIEEFNYPKYGPGMMWERCTELITAKGTKVVFDSHVTKIEHADGRAVRGDRAHRQRAHQVRVHTPHLVDADQRAAPRDGPAGAGRRRRSGFVAALPGLHHGRARRPRSGRLPRQLDLHQRPERQGRQDPELRPVVPLPREGRAYVPRASSCSSTRATSGGRWPTRT